MVLGILKRGKNVLTEHGKIKNIKLVPLSNVNRECQLRVREIRNEDAIRKWMYTDHVIGVKEHLSWINNIRTDRTLIVFVILNEDDNPLGVVSVNAIDHLHKKADWAYYLTQNARGGLGSAIEYAFINFVFDELDIQKLNCEVIERNYSVVRLHKKFLFKDEGFRRSNIIKNNERIGVHLLGLTKQDWIDGKSQVYEKYQEILNKFCITIKWDVLDRNV